MTRLKDLHLYEEAKSQYGWELISSGNKYKKYMKEVDGFKCFAELEGGSVMAYCINPKGVYHALSVYSTEMEWLVARAKETM